jgi:hypothetical protein
MEDRADANTVKQHSILMRGFSIKENTHAHIAAPRAFHSSKQFKMGVY